MPEPLVNGLTFGSWMKGVDKLLWSLLDVNAHDLAAHDEIYSLWSNGFSPQEAVNVIVSDDELLSIVRRAMG